MLCWERMSSLRAAGSKFYRFNLDIAEKFTWLSQPGETIEYYFSSQSAQSGLLLPAETPINCQQDRFRWSFKNTHLKTHLVLPEPLALTPFYWINSVFQIIYIPLLTFLLWLADAIDIFFLTWHLPSWLCVSDYECVYASFKQCRRLK